MSQVKYDNLIVSSAPHVVDEITTSSIMSNVLIALVPAFIMSAVVFGARAIVLTLVCVVACMFFEWAFRKLTNRSNTISDLSAAVTGVLLAFNLPSNFPFWMAIIGCFAAIVVVKQLFGGLGQNFVNPAITGRIVLFVSFAAQMTTWPTPMQGFNTFSDAVTSATPLALMSKGQLDQLPSNMSMFLGTIGGSLGETSAIALILGGIYLVVRKIISPTIPVSFIATVAVIALLAGKDPIFQICAGGVMLGAIFMATDYVTSPLTTKGKIVFGIGCGCITMVIRLFGSYPEGVSFSILLMNILVPHIDTLTRTKVLGEGGVKK